MVFFSVKRQVCFSVYTSILLSGALCCCFSEFIDAGGGVEEGEPPQEGILSELPLKHVASFCP